MSHKWKSITQRFYRASRKRFDLELTPRQLFKELMSETDKDIPYPKLRSIFLWILCPHSHQPLAEFFTKHRNLV